MEAGSRAEVVGGLAEEADSRRVRTTGGTAAGKSEAEDDAGGDGGRCCCCDPAAGGVTGCDEAAVTDETGR